MKKQTFFWISSLVVSSGFALALFTPKNSRQYALSYEQTAKKDSIEKELKKKFKITHDFSEFSIFVFESSKDIKSVRKSLESIGEVELIHSHQLKALSFLKKFFK